MLAALEDGLSTAARPAPPQLDELMLTSSVLAVRIAGVVAGVRVVIVNFR